MDRPVVVFGLTATNYTAVGGHRETDPIAHIWGLGGIRWLHYRESGIPHASLPSIEA